MRRFLGRYPFLLHQWFKILVVLVFTATLFMLFVADDSKFLSSYMGKSQKELLLEELGPEFEGTYRQKFLHEVSEKELWTDSFYQNWNILGHLDELIDEPIDDLEYDEVEIANLWDLMNEYQSNDQEPKKFDDLSPLDKVSVYADELLPKSNFHFTPVKDQIYKDIYNPSKFKSSRLKKWTKIKSLLEPKDLEKLNVNDETMENAIQAIIDKKKAHNEASALRVKHTLDHIKTFGALFLKNPEFGSFSDQACVKTEKTLFPWLSGKLPVYSTFNLKSNKVEVKKFQSEIQCNIKKLQSGLKGKGIVVTANDMLVPELSGLISIMKLNGNKLPVQIVHKGDLSKPSIKHLVKIASDPIMKLPSIKDSKTMSMSKITTFELTFVDVSKVIDDKFKSYFNGFGMKLLALLFSSFEEMIMLDTDTVPLLPLKDYFEMEGYTSTSTLFFRDREANSFIYDGIVQFFKSFLNSEYENHYLGLPKVTEETLHNRFFGDSARHFMESGLFAINKKQKFDGVLLSVVLQFFQLFTGSLHGEKEFIWLGQEYMSNNYNFNKHGAVSIGELSSGREEQGLKSHELCSTHPGHLDDDGKTLLWFNSGFMTCKKPQSYFKDVNYARNKGKSLQELKLEYISPLVIKHALIPPPAEYFSSSFSQDNELDKNQMIDPEMNAEITPQQLFDTEPIRSWIMTPHCSNYLWCAYDIIQGGEQGKFISFTPELTDLWQFWGHTWVGYFQGAKLKTADGDLGYFEDKFEDELGLDDSNDEEEEESAALLAAARKAAVGEDEPEVDVTAPKQVKSAKKLLTKGGKPSNEEDKKDTAINPDEGDSVSPLILKATQEENQEEATEEDSDNAVAINDNSPPRKQTGADKLSGFARFRNKGNK